MVYTGNPVIKILPSVTWKKENDIYGLGKIVYVVRMLKALPLIAYKI